MIERSANESRITRLAVISQLLFTAGHSLTSRGFFYYFVNEFHPSARMMALLQVAPETAETAGIAARWTIRKLGTRKWIWICLVVLARLAALGIPLILLWQGVISDGISLWWILLCTILWYGAQGIAYVTYISWLSDLVPAWHWGRFFAKWKIASLVVTIAVPTAVGLARSEYLKALSPGWQTWSYGVIFAAGCAIVIASVLPMLRLPECLPSEKHSSRSEFAPNRKTIRALLRDQNYRWFLIHYWWLSAFQGLTQAVVFLYSSRVLQISLKTYYWMNGTMLLLQIPFSVFGGRLSDRQRDREVLMAGLLAVSCAMGFWLVATPDHWWLAWGAYAIWGLFGAVNVCEQNLNLKLAPPGDNTLHLSLVRQWGGLFAAAAGLLGGWWLDTLTGGESFTPQSALWPFQLIFAISWIGRATAALWLFGIRRRKLDVQISTSPANPKHELSNAPREG